MFRAREVYSKMAAIVTRCCCSCFNFPPLGAQEFAVAPDRWRHVCIGREVRWLRKRGAALELFAQRARRARPTFMSGRFLYLVSPRLSPSPHDSVCASPPSVSFLSSESGWIFMTSGRRCLSFFTRLVATARMPIYWRLCTIFCLSLSPTTSTQIV